MKDLGSWERDGYTPATPSHPFTPDVVEWARDMVKHYATGPITPMVALRVKAARQIIAVVDTTP